MSGNIPNTPKKHNLADLYGPGRASRRSNDPSQKGRASDQREAVKMGEYYDMQGNPIDMQEWVVLFGKKERIIKQETLPNGKFVSTVYLGLDHSFGMGGPLIFETMVFPKKGDGHDIDIKRYATLEEAKEGHKRMVEKYYPLDKDLRNKIINILASGIKLLNAVAVRNKLQTKIITYGPKLGEIDGFIVGLEPEVFELADKLIILFEQEIKNA